VGSWDEINADAHGFIELDNRVKPISWSVFDIANPDDKYRIEWRNTESGTNDLDVFGAQIFVES